MLKWLLNVSLIGLFLFMLAAHALMYYLYGTENFFMVALSASLVWTVVVGIIQLSVRRNTRAR
ncbi:hypothetical protein [Paenibacillus turpanensis]|uniref:hypothetical protein n=1 Tax=Paenibacillus turpanensis TaxID=2689078 RepID=UPI00140806AB|nr:hypothetical protein [Paenibacillus turpanensis]